MAHIMTVCAAVSHTSYSFDMLFTYRVPQSMADEVMVGKRIVVPFGKNNSKRIAMIFGVEQHDAAWAAEHNIKPVIAVADSEPAIGPEMTELAGWLRDNTFCTYFEAVSAILPSGMHINISEKYSLSDKEYKGSLTDEESNFYTFCRNTKSSFELDALVHEKLKTDKKKKRIVDSLIEKGILCLNCSVEKTAGVKSQKMVRLTSEYLENPLGYRLTPKQKAVAELLGSDISYAMSEVCYICGVTPAVPQAMQKNGIAEIYEKRIMRDVCNADKSESIDDLILNDKQQAAFERIEPLIKDDSKAECFLLHGVTGSGKTSVFKKLINTCVKNGKQAMLLLPEISLTPQIVGQFRRLFGSLVTVIHSGLSAGQRLDAFARIKKGEALIIIGTRSAVFAPAENLALIIMDEEGEKSYKSSAAPRYNTVDVAKQRCRYHNAVLVLSSATPSIESYFLAERGIYKLIEMDKRYSDAPLPDVRIVDLGREESYGTDPEFSRILIDEINENLRRCQQTILLLNRRGYHTIVSCIDCRKPVMCPNCSVPMTYHKKNKKLMCHYCGELADIPQSCSSCGSKRLYMSGSGTQRLEEQIQELFPKARILRMDADTVFSRDSYEKNIKDFEDGKYDILVGTQMVGKGLDFPNVTLVGILSVDKALYSGNFRSYERTFSLIAQVAGRGGRGELRGRAVLQTHIPDHYVIKLAAAQDYKSFYKEEIAERKTFIFPPVCDLCVIGITGTDEEQVKAASARLLEYIKKKILQNKNSAMPLRILGPSQCIYGKINKKYRYRIIIKCKNTSQLRAFIRDILVNGTRDRIFSRLSVFADMNGDSDI